MSFATHKLLSRCAHERHLSFTACPVTFIRWPTNEEHIFLWVTKKVKIGPEYRDNDCSVGV